MCVHPCPRDGYRTARSFSGRVGFVVCMRHVWAVGAALFVTALSAAAAQGPRSVAEQYLFSAANAERAQRGLRPLRWDEALYRAALRHAEQMAARASISHQYAGEAGLASRAERAGARFSVVAENVAEAPTAVVVHSAWMHSAHHRENLLDPRVDEVGIAVLDRGGELYAVQDFDRSVATLSLEDQESAVAELLNASGMAVQTGDGSARQTCAMETGFAGPRRPWFVMRFSTGELDALPGELRTRLASGRYHSASVGACFLSEAQPFSSYTLAVLLFP